jgi:hypothetical protein
MSPVFRRDPAGHDRAQELAATRIDEPLEAADAAWLDAHLAGCDACAAATDAFDADRVLFGALRDAPPTPPRDLWARTAAAIDAESAGRRNPLARRIRGVPALTLAPVAGLAAVAIVVGAGLLNGSPVVPGPGDPSGPAPTPIALAPGDVAVLTRGADGSYQVERGVVDEVCPLVAESCGANPSFEATQLARIDGTGSVGAIISPAKDRLVVVQRGASGVDGVYVVPVRPGGGGTTAASAAPSEAPATVAPVTAPPASVDPSMEPGQSGDPVETVPAVTPSPDPSAEAPSASTDPAQSPSPEPPATPEASPQPTPTVAVTAAPEGGDAIQIARDVIVVGGIAAYDANGSRFAFTARPADGSTGPDVYVWDTTEPLARAVTTDHRSIFAGWDGRELLVSRVVDGTPRTLHVDARTGAEKDAPGHAAWLPTLAPDRARAAWWNGSVDLADDDLTWVPEKGRLVLGEWPSGDDEQVLARGALAAWEVRWNATGTVVGVWTTTEAGPGAGRLSLYPVDPTTGRARLDAPILEEVPAFAGFAVEDGRAVYPGPGSDGARSLWVVAWRDGSVVGRVELDGEDGATVIR